MHYFDMIEDFSLLDIALGALVLKRLVSLSVSKTYQELAVA